MFEKRYGRVLLVLFEDAKHAYVVYFSDSEAAVGCIVASHVPQPLREKLSDRGYTIMEYSGFIGMTLKRIEQSYSSTKRFWVA